MTVTVCWPGVAFAGRLKVAWIVYCVGRDTLVPVMVPTVTLLIGAFCGGTAGLAVLDSVMVAVTLAPRLPIAGAMLLMPLLVVPPPPPPPPVAAEFVE